MAWACIERTRRDVPQSVVIMRMAHLDMYRDAQSESCLDGGLEELLGHWRCCQTTFHSLPNHVLNSVARSALFGGKSSLLRQPKQRHRPLHRKPSVQLHSSILPRSWPRSIN